MKSYHLLLGWAGVLLALWLGRVATPASEPAKAEDLFSSPRVLKVRLEVGGAELESLRRDGRAYVKATLREGGETLTEVGLRLKGRGVFQGFEKRPGLSLKFNEFIPGQKWGGQTKVLLDNAAHDPSYLCEVVGGQLFREAGVPAARCTFARLEVNGKDCGLFIVVEAANRDFLSAAFKKSKGNLYEGSNADINEKLEKDSGDPTTDQSDLKVLVAAVKEPDPAQRLKKLASLLDVERFITFAACEVFLDHRDGYCLDRNNYRIYHNPASDQLVFLPHSLDRLLAHPDAPITPEWRGLVAKAVMETPEGQRRYREALAQLLAGPGKEEVLQMNITELAAKIRPAIAEQNEMAGKAFDASVAQLKESVTRRVAFVEQQFKSASGSK